MKKIDFVLKHMREKRQNSGMRLVDVCAAFEDITGQPLTENALHLWEKGKRRITLENFLVLAEIYECSPAILLDEPCMHRNEDILADFSALPDNEKQILRYMLREWDGDAHALINSIGAYMDLDEQNRYKMSRYGMRIYNANKDEFALADEDTIAKGFDVLKKKVY